MPTPMIDGLLRTLFRLDVRFLNGKSESMKNTTDLWSGIAYTPFFENEIGDDSRRPSVGEISGGLGSSENDRFEFGFLFVVDLGVVAGIRFSSETLEAVALNFRTPTFDGGERRFGDIDDGVVVESAQNQFAGQSPATGLRGNASILCTHNTLYAA